MKTKVRFNSENTLTNGTLSQQFGLNVKEDVLKKKLKFALEALTATQVNSPNFRKPQDSGQPITNKFVGWRRR